MKAPFLIPFLFAAGLLSCRKEIVVYEPFGNSEGRVDTKVWITPHQSLDSTASFPNFYLEIQTEREYANLNYQIEYTLSEEKDGDFFLRLGKVLSSEVVLPATGPASATLALDPAWMGDRTFKVHSPLGTTSFAYSYSPNQVALEGDDFSAGLLLSRLEATPPTALWGLLMADSASGPSLVQSLSDSLLTLGATPAAYPTGQYEYFEVDASGHITTRHDSAPSLFVREVLWEGGSISPSQLEAFLTRFRAQAGSALSYLHFWDGKGRNF